MRTHPQGQSPALREVLRDVVVVFFTVPHVHESPQAHDEPVGTENKYKEERGEGGAGEKQ